MSMRAGCTLDAFTFRPNIVVEMCEPWPAEETWIDRTIVIGENVRLRIAGRTERCTMVNVQSDGGVDPRIIQTIVRANETCLGVYASVETFGEIHEGDTIFVACAGH